LLGVGAWALGGLWGGMSQSPAASAGSGRARSLVLIWLQGGPSQLETFDPQPAADAGIRGAFGAVGVAGMEAQICDRLPRLAARGRAFSLVRGLSHAASDHGAATEAILGSAAGRPGGFPAEFARRRSGAWFRPGFFVGFREMGCGFAGAATLPALPAEEAMTGEREHYGGTRFGDHCRRARRVVAGQGGVIVLSLPGWDAHCDLRHRYPRLLATLDAGLAALLDDLRERGLLETTLVAALGEFGRHPQLNAEGGRDHWPRAGCALVAGGGLPGGTVWGGTDRFGSEPLSAAWNPATLHGLLRERWGAATGDTREPALWIPAVTSGKPVRRRHNG